MRIQCNKFPDTVIEPAVEAIPEIKEGDEVTQEAVPGKPAVTEPSCRFYYFPNDDNNDNRVKVHVDGKVDFKAVAKNFKDKGVTVSEADLKKAYEA